MQETCHIEDITNMAEINSEMAQSSGGQEKTPGRKTTLGLLAAHCCRSEYMTFHFIYHLPLVIIIVMMSCV